MYYGPAQQWKVFAVPVRVYVSAPWKYGSRHWDTWDTPQTWINDTQCIRTACVCVLHANISNFNSQISYYAIYMYLLDWRKIMDYRTCRGCVWDFLSEKPKGRIFVNFSRYQFSTTKSVFDKIQNNANQM